jgi:integrase
VWAKRKRYIAESPISDESIIKGEKGAERRRRIYADEEDRLLAIAPRRLQSLIVAALESLCRLGELLALKWRDVNLDKRTLLIAAKEVGAGKTKKAHVFGDEIGERTKSIKKAWETCVLKARAASASGPARGAATPCRPNRALSFG